MFSALQVLTVILVAVAMALTLAHALEFLGKKRLDKQSYYAIQPAFSYLPSAEPDANS